MKKLTGMEYEAVVAAIERKPYDRYKFNSGARKMLYGSALRPDFALEYPQFPRMLSEFRANKDWALQHVERHQAACDAARNEYWKVMTGRPEREKGGAA